MYHIIYTDVTKRRILNNDSLLYVHILVYNTNKYLFNISGRYTRYYIRRFRIGNRT